MEETKLVDSYLKKMDWRLNENSNMNFSVQGLNNYIASSVSADHWLNSLYSKEARDAHIDGDFHIHDLGMLAPYCQGLDFKDLLMVGFRGQDSNVQGGPPKHFRSVLGQLVNFLCTLQTESAGAQAISRFDTYLAPFIRYDGIGYDDVKQGLQEFVYSLNIPTRIGSQPPFTNLTMDAVATGELSKENVIIGGKIMEEKYKDFQPEMDMINEALFEIFLEGDDTGRPFSFPIPTYNITKEFDWDNKALDNMWNATAKYGTPYFANFVNSDMDVENIRSMCCRINLNLTEIKKRGGGLFGANPLTGSINVVTLNMSRIGYLAKDKKDYFDRVEKLLELARDVHETKRELLEKYTDAGLYPYTKYYLRNVKKRFGKNWTNHFSTTGVNGMNESLLNFIGKDILSKEGKEFAEEVLDFINDKLLKYQKETGNMYNLEATPAEGTTYRFAKRDKMLYPDIIVANNKEVDEYGAAPYYTNSSWLHVGRTADVFEMLDNQDSLQTRYSSGTVAHIFLGQRLQNGDAAKTLIRKVTSIYKLPYISISPTFSICPVHGYLEGEYEYCPKCDAENGYVEDATNK